MVYEAGVMNGFTVSRFAPEEPLMPEQLAAVCARLYDLLTGGSGAFPPWQKTRPGTIPTTAFWKKPWIIRGNRGPRMMRKAADRLSEQRK